MVSEDKQPSPELNTLIEQFVGALRDQVLPDESILEKPTPRWEYRKCHSYTCYTCNHPTTLQYGHGPYLYLYWKEKGKLRKKYLGKDPNNYLNNKLEKFCDRLGNS